MIYNKAKKTFSVSPVFEINDAGICYKRGSDDRFINYKGEQSRGKFCAGLVLMEDWLLVKP